MGSSSIAKTDIAAIGQAKLQAVQAEELRRKAALSMISASERARFRAVKPYKAHQRLIPAIAAAFLTHVGGKSYDFAAIRGEQEDMFEQCIDRRKLTKCGRSEPQKLSQH